MPKDKKLALKLGIQTYQILTNDDEVCIPSLSSILLAVSIQSVPIRRPCQSQTWIYLLFMSLIDSDFDRYSSTPD